MEGYASPERMPQATYCPKLFRRSVRGNSVTPQNKPVYELVFSERMNADPVPTIGDKSLTILENARKS
ncbi:MULTISPECIES: hypothetical protein [unclassified Brucella]|uniref:hypothetical protein n=1 Tax=unclassified Brucella TaxID=2632610 RepID=UPI0012ADEB95|nr:MULTISPECIES: hypothetical protein [unclassified Brucella]MRN44319.1 hypothetical protein [Brucella sp. 09RB8913]MRN59688.1 hypothetical protein [Brucella sp. 09RB8918]QTN99449.1 hypothetical protein J8E27_04845 [Brucella sp. 458]